MAVLLTARGIEYGFGGQTLLDGVDLQIDPGERIGLLGRNGAGKSTLLRILHRELAPDGGGIETQPGLRTALLPQDLPPHEAGTVFATVAQGLGRRGALSVEYRKVSRRLASGNDLQVARRLEDLHQELDAADGWDAERDVDRILSTMALDPDARYERLSAGLKRSVLLARALVAKPDLLLLDEPTNHLDIASIDRIEAMMLKWPGALLFITHDRAFLERLAGRIVELDRGRLTTWRCDYPTYLQRREAALDAEAQANKRQDRKLADEEAWKRKGLKARRRRNEGRVRALKALRAERQARRAAAGDPKMLAQQAERSGRLVLVAEDVAYQYDGQAIIHSFSGVIMRGDKVGIIGPNGCGKSTLLQILLGQLPPQDGRVRHGTRLEIAYFDQLRDQLDETRSVQDNVSDGNDTLVINGKRRHVLGYLKDFLFTPERARSPVKVLSGGERNRLLLARLFARPANLLVLDEPTNDLDLPTLELLEDLLVAFEGTLLLVSHDRAFINNVVTSTLAFEGDGRVAEYVGGYEDWIRQRPTPRATAAPAGPSTASRRERRPRPRKLGYREKEELEALPGRIEALESEQAALFANLSDPQFYQGEGHAVADVRGRLAAVETELQAAYRRWEELEAVGQQGETNAAN
ncbi:MAG: ATP-binding cassette domain-containing protein [Desulfobacterales bacterium]|nr:ATP-binding cassette domain-containing protein [Desulfobacterales bacterium]MDJ0854990.1 ATP-binding cassette domain-containing protein [Desulfobacterales bacterium]